MHIIEIVYIAGALVALFAGVSQLKKLLVTKASDELSLPTWLTWLGTQCTALLYTLSIGNTLMVIVNSAWIAFYAVMVGVIIHYRSQPLFRKTQLMQEEVEPIG